MSDLQTRVRSTIRDVADFPKPGVLFKDITPILADCTLMSDIIDWMADTPLAGSVDVVVGMESRGFFFGPGLAMKLGCAFAPARKKGKLPHATESMDYTLEYGSSTLEMHVDAFPKGSRVLVVDDLLATGGTARATLDLIRKLGGDPIEACFLLELGFLNGREKLDVPVRSLTLY